MANSFRDAVLTNCEELIAAHGFRLRDGDESCVALDSSSVIISFAYDRVRAFELNVSIATKSKEEAGTIPFSLGEVMREFNVPRSKERSYLQSSSLEQVAIFVRDVCEALIQYCKPILDGDAAAFERVRAGRAIASKQYTLELRLAGIRKEVDEAWRTKDYSKYRALLAGLESVLSESEKKKLEFAATK